MTLFKLLRIMDAYRRQLMSFAHGILKDAKTEIRIACLQHEGAILEPVIKTERTKARIDSIIWQLII